MNTSLPTISIDFLDRGAKIKPLHGVNRIDPPSAWFDNPQYKLLKDAGVPFNRLHDVGGAFGGNLYVDIPNLFRDFNADENDPASYDFAFTDYYLAKTAETGAKPFFRLGVTIENHAFKVKHYRTDPPADYAKWARICEHVVRHYNEGWANGFQMGIEYWEIWNEPDGVKCCWAGTPEQYFELYRVAANHLKGCFPNIKVGGPATCSPNKFSENFLAYITNPATQAPIDFFSWHCYSFDLAQYEKVLGDAKAQLEKAGLFGKVESICDEWNLAWWKRGEIDGPSHAITKRGPIGASFVASIFSIFQDSPAIDVSAYYDAYSVSAFGALFEPFTLLPSKTYYSFLAFNELYQLGFQAKSKVEGAPCVRVLAATDEWSSIRRAMIANYNSCPTNVALDVRGATTLFSARLLAEETRGLEMRPDIVDHGVLALPPWSVALLAW